MDRLGIKPSKLLRKAIIDEIKKREIEELERLIDELKDALDKIEMERVVRSIREDREGR